MSELMTLPTHLASVLKKIKRQTTSSWQDHGRSKEGKVFGEKGEKLPVNHYLQIYTHGNSTER